MMRGMRWGWLVAMFVGALGGVAVGYVVGSEGPLGEGALSLAAATIGGLLALLGAFGIQLRRDQRDDLRARRDRQEAVMLESYHGLVAIRDLTFELVQGRSSGIEINSARSHLRPTLGMIDDNELLQLAVQALDGFATTAHAIAPDPPATPASRDEVRAALDRDRQSLDAMAVRIGDIGRAWRGREILPPP